MRCQWDRLKVKHISVCLFPQSLLGNLYENHFNTLNRKSIILPLSNFSLCQHNQSYKLWCLQGWTSQLNQSVHSVCLFLSLSLLSNLAHLFCSSRQMSRSRLIRSLLHFVIYTVHGTLSCLSKKGFTFKTRVHRDPLLEQSLPRTNYCYSPCPKCHSFHLSPQHILRLFPVRIQILQCFHLDQRRDQWTWENKLASNYTFSNLMFSCRCAG